MWSYFPLFFLQLLFVRSFRGIPSQGMILCAERPTGEACEVIRPPAGAAIGDRVTVPGFPGKLL